MWVYQTITNDPYVATSFRSLLAMLLLLAFWVMLQIPITKSRTGSARFAWLCARVYALGRSLYYWLLVVGGIPVVGTTNGKLSWLLLYGFTLELVLVLGLGFWSKQSAERS